MHAVTGLAVLSCVLLGASVASAATLTVCKTGCSFVSIQSAVTAAHVGDTVEVRANGSLGYTQQVTVPKRITLEGDPNGPRPVLKLAPTSADMPTLAFTNAAGGSTLKHMMVLSNGPSSDSGNDAIDFDDVGGTVTDVSATATGIPVFVGAAGDTIGPAVTATSTGTALDDDIGGSTITGVTATATGGDAVAAVVKQGTTVQDSSFSAGNGGSTGLHVQGATVRRVKVSGWEGIRADGGLITDSVATSTTAAAVQAGGAAQLRNVTAIASGQGSDGVAGDSNGAIVAKNVIARGGPGGSDLATEAGGTMQVGYSNFTSSTPGVDVSTIGHNQSVDPLFVNGTVGPAEDFHLQNGSPAIGAGVSDAQTGTSDLDGHPRPAAGQTAPSLGAYEPTSDTLNVVVSGTGSGAVSGSGISCPSNCSHTYAPGTVVTLTATPTAGSVFAGWGGACSGAGSCQVTMQSEHTVNATFALVPPANRTLPVIGGAPARGQTVVASDGTWNGAPTLFTYQWQRCAATGGSCASIVSATGNTYRVGTGDVGRRLRVVVTASNAGGARSATSAPTKAVTAVVPVPVLTHVRLRPTEFVASRGTVLTVTLSEFATVRVLVVQLESGRKSHGRCQAAAKHGKRCTLKLRKGSASFRGIAGSNHFMVRVRGLRPGRYQATVAASASGKTSKPVALNFAVTKPSKRR